jgi:hypothetical protein
MVKGKIKSIMATILSTVSVAVFAMGFVACAQGDKAPQSFVCSETNLTMELSKDKSHYIVTHCPEDKTEIVIKDKYYGKPVKEIGEFAFDGCESLTKISIPDCMTRINVMALSACKSLEYTEAEGVKYLGNEGNPYVYLVKPLSEDITSVVVQDTCKAIGISAFYNYSKLKSVSLPEGLENIGASAFGYCGFISISLPSSLKNIESGAFKYCQKLKSIMIPEGVTEIHSYTFQGCSRLGSVSFGENLKNIWEFSFSECGLKSVSIPDGATTIGLQAFYGCGELTSVYFLLP